ncbi:hypothetical protein D6827_00935 [Candidatus Parcubacteria bacterium]|nr:MAG: hypothetical protein D6827_00935 [Candidatus Parcubacteria bacterium]
MAIPKNNNRNDVNGFIWDEKNAQWVAIAGNSSGSVIVKKEVPDGESVFFEDASFVSADSPVVLDFNTSLGRNAQSVLIINDGTGEFTFAWSSDGVNFSDEIRLKAHEYREYEDASIYSLRITWVADSAYRVEAI